MRFSDQDIRIKIKSNVSNVLVDWKAYVEKCDVSYEVQEQNLSFAPVSFKSTHIAVRLLQNIDLSFNVFAESPEEALENYNKLHKLIDILKPTYSKIGVEYAPDKANTFGLISLDFGLLPIIKKDNVKVIDIGVKKFSYIINQELGVIQRNYVKDIALQQFSNLDITNPSIIPIGFKIDLGGRVLLDLSETGNTSGFGDAAAPTALAPEAIAAKEFVALGITGDTAAAVYDAYNNVASSGLPINVARNANTIIQRGILIKSAIDNSLIERATKTWKNNATPEEAKKISSIKQKLYEININDQT